MPSVEMRSGVEMRQKNETSGTRQVHRLRKTGMPGALGVCLIAALGLSAMALAQGAVTGDGERIVVPLSAPGEPATVEISLIQGGVTVEAYSGQEVIVEARGRASRDGEKEKEKERSRKPAEDDSRAGMRRIPNDTIGLTVEEEDNEVSIDAESWRRAVDLKILVPARTSLAISCINTGDISVSGVEGDLELENVNGSIIVRGAAGTVLASTTNGQIKVTFARLSGSAPMAFSSFNGSVDLTFPAGLAAVLDLKTGQGDIYTDFDVAVEKGAPRVETRRQDGRFRVEMDRGVRGRVGSGGREIRVETFNGDIFLRRGT